MRLDGFKKNFLRSRNGLILPKQRKISNDEGTKVPSFFSVKELDDRLIKIVKEEIESEPALFLVEVLVKGTIGSQKVLIFIDGDEGVSIDHCSQISRKVGAKLEEEDFFEGKYFLEVSSPGLDHPIRLRRQYEKNVGRHVEVEKNDGEKVKGKLLKVEKDAIVLLTKDKAETERAMDFNEINQSKIEVSFK